ncbi:MAG: hypothetical protein DHS20C18_47460 [Saprospiraceae bacterium]|nr:MAG: hypothetical protein DHS20C18_47460 [Saprospiraceae bacterium]
MGLLFITLGLNAQNCSAFFPFKEKTTVEYANYNKKEKLQSYTRSTITVVDDTADGGLEAQVETSTMDEKKEVIQEGAYQVVCKDNTLYMDLSDMLNPEMTESFSHMEVTIQGDKLVLPSDLEIGQVLPDAQTEIQAASGGINLLKMNFVISDRKVEAKESITTPAGTYECYKVNHSMDVKMLVKKSFQVSTWYNEKVGMVKQETYDRKGRLDSRIELNLYQEN